VQQLKTVFDPEIPVDIYELGLIYKVKLDEDGAVAIRMTLTSPMCPAARAAARGGVEDAQRSGRVLGDARSGVGPAVESRHDVRGGEARAGDDVTAPAAGHDMIPMLNARLYLAAVIGWLETAVSP
jgi:hypothetical protein